MAKGARMTRRICVTGANGLAGKAVVQELREHGYDVAATDIVTRFGEDSVLRADLTDYGQAIEALSGADAVVHLANIPAPGLTTPAATFNANMTMNFNVFHAAATLKLSRVVWASSETTLGLPFDVPPRYAPVDEDHYPVPTSTYALSKVASETVAEQIAGWSGIPFVALRISNIFDPQWYDEEFRGFWDDPALRKWNLWGYIDVRDVALACRLGLEADVTGAESVIIAASDTVMNRPSADLLAEVFPGVPLTRDVGKFGTLLANDRARQVLGFEPRHSWRDHLEGLCRGPGGEDRHGIRGLLVQVAVQQRGRREVFDHCEANRAQLGVDLVRGEPRQPWFTAGRDACGPFSHSLRRRIHVIHDQHCPAALVRDVAPGAGDRWPGQVRDDAEPDEYGGLTSIESGGGQAVADR
jgi:nucleoside-diphosphate-sugar epimerase